MSNLRSRKIRTTSWLVGLSVIALAFTARAQPTSATVETAPPAVGVAEAPAPMPVAAAEPPREPTKRLQLGVSFLPMARGKHEVTAAGMTEAVDGAFAYGVGFVAAYRLVSGLSLGVAPQLIFNGKPKEASAEGGKQWDLLARVAYDYAIADVVSLYAEVLPGYSIFYPPGSDTSKGLVIAVGVGAAMDLTQRLFAQLGVGYQMGFQSQTAVASYHTNYVRVSLGGGVKF